MPSEQTLEPVDLRRYLTIIRARKWTISIVAAVTFAAVMAWSYSQPAVYRSQARVLVEPLEDGGADVARPPDMETAAQVVASELVAGRVLDEIQYDGTTTQLLRNLHVVPVAGTDVLEIAFSSMDPEFAARVANEFAMSYIELRVDAAREVLEAAERKAEEDLREALGQLEILNEDLRRAEKDRDDVLLSALDTQRTSLLTRIGLLQQRADEADPDEALALTGGQIIQEAEAPTVPASPNHPLAAAVGGFFALLLGAGAGLLRERLDDRLGSREKVEAVTGLPVLGTVPRYKLPATGSRPRKATSKRSLVVAADTQSPASEAYRLLRTNVLFLGTQQEARVLLVTSPSQSEGKTVTSANLAVALAQAGQRVILVSADLRRPSLESYFEVESNAPGLTEWLVGDVKDPMGLVVDPKVKNLRLLPAGMSPHNPSELLASPRLPQLVEWLRANSDFAIIDSTPLLGLADAVALAPLVDATLMIVHSSSTRRSRAVHAKQQLERANARIVGCVLNAADRASASYDGYGAYYSDDGRATRDQEPAQKKRARRKRAPVSDVS